MIFHREANGPRNLTKVTQESLGTLPVAEHRDRLSSVTSLTGGTVHHETTGKSLAKEGKHSQVNRILTRAGSEPRDPRA